MRGRGRDRERGRQRDRERGGVFWLTKREGEGKRKRLFSLLIQLMEVTQNVDKFNPCILFSISVL